MIGFIKGKILAITPDCALIETAAGLGFEVACSYSAFSALAGKKEGELYTYMQVGENGVALYGFSSQEEKNMFLKLITVSGVGPKMGIAILSGLNTADVAVKGGEAVPQPAAYSGDEDAVVALMTLGFSRSESEKAIYRARSQGAQSVEDIIMIALKGM